MAKKLRLKRPELAETEIGEEVDVALEVAVDSEETEAEVAGVVAATIVANTGIWLGIVIEMAATVEVETVEMTEEGLAEAEVVVAEEADATIVERMVTWLGIVTNLIAEIVEADNFVTKRKQI